MQLPGASSNDRLKRGGNFKAAAAFMSQKKHCWGFLATAVLRPVVARVSSFGSASKKPHGQPWPAALVSSAAVARARRRAADAFPGVRWGVVAEAARWPGA